MKIDVGTAPRLIGTRRVNTNGAITGLTDIKGEDVLIVRPSALPRYLTTPEDLVAQVRVQARQGAKSALKGFRDVRRRFLEKPSPAARKIAAALPAQARPLVRKAERILQRSALRLEQEAASLLSR